MTKYKIDSNIPQTKENLIKKIESLDSDSDYSVEIKPYRKSKTLDQLGYYFGIVIPIASQELGYDNEEMHLVLKTRLLSRQYELKSGEYVQVVPSVRDFNIAEMSEYIDKVINFLASELDIVVPDPE